MKLARRLISGASTKLQRRPPIPFAESARGEWLFRSFDDLFFDIQEWSKQIPHDVIAVCGIPRSGVIVASILSTYLNVPLLSLDSLRQRHKSWRPSVSKPLPVNGKKTILVVDDTVWSGGTLQEVQASIPEDILESCIFGAVYINARNTTAVQTFGFPVESIQHCFSWNYLRDIHSRKILTDMDGVLCEEWSGSFNHIADVAYLDFLENAAPRVKPIYPVLGIVTGRVAEHRTVTEKWLSKHGIGFRNLLMPFSTYEQRKGQCIGSAKAEIYRSHQEAILFVESDRTQAQVIHHQTKRPVLCTNTQEMFQNG